MISGKTIFISPLDWGLGHATRCIPLIRSLSEKNKIVIGITHLNVTFFNEHFPELQKVELPSYGISYSKHLPLWLKLLVQWPKITSVIRKEKTCLQEIISNYNIDVVISDNRFGLTNKSVYSIFITHQLNLKTPFFSKIANSINRNYIHKFNEVWVPDFEEENRRLSGQLSDSTSIKIPVKYIGPKSALENLATGETISENFDYLILLSGVEPQRSILEKLLLEKFRNTHQKIILVRGSNTNLKTRSANFTVINFALGEELKSLICKSGTVICRSGYSSLMDMYILNKKKIILIPTPGQTEQEYLAVYWNKKFGAVNLAQNKVQDHSFY